MFTSEERTTPKISQQLTAIRKTDGLVDHLIRFAVRYSWYPHSTVKKPTQGEEEKSYTKAAAARRKNSKKAAEKRTSSGTAGKIEAKSVG